MRMSVGEFKKLLEDNGVKDDWELNIITVERQCDRIGKVDINRTQLKPFLFDESVTMTINIQLYNQDQERSIKESL